MQRRNKNKITYLIFVIVILLLGIGYAFLTTNLNITGTTVLKDNRWDLHLENVVVKSGSVTASTPTIDTSRTTVSYGVTLNTPGDFYEFTVDCKNDGSIDGMIESFVSKLNGNPITTLPNALEYSVTYSDGVAITNNQILEAGEKETIKVYVACKRDIEASELPSTETSLNLTFTITYVQADVSAIEVDHLHPVYTVNIYNGSDSLNKVYLGQPIGNGITQYSSSQELLGNWTLPFYLKHMIQSNVVIDSYVEFAVTQEMANNNTGMTPGTYSLRGVATYDSNAICKPEYADLVNDLCLGPYYEANKQILLNAFGNNHCADHTDYLSCLVNGLYAHASLDGDVVVNDGSAVCRIDIDGSSYCDV